MDFVKSVPEGQIKLSFMHGRTVNAESVLLSVTVTGKVSTDPEKVSEYEAYIFNSMLIMTRAWIWVQEKHDADATAADVDLQLYHFLQMEGFEPMILSVQIPPKPTGGN